MPSEICLAGTLVPTPSKWVNRVNRNRCPSNRHRGFKLQIVRRRGIVVVAAAAAAAAAAAVVVKPTVIQNTGTRV